MSLPDEPSVTPAPAGTEGARTARDPTAEERAATAVEFYALLEPAMEALRRYTYQRVGQAHDAEDVFQEATVKALRSFKTLTNKKAFKKWMRKIIYNENIARTRRQHWRREQPLGTASTEGEEFDPPAPGVAVDDSVCAHDRVEYLLGVLPENERAAVRLVLLEGVLRKDAADRLRVDRGTVTDRYRRGLNRLRTAANEDERPQP